MSDPLSGYRHIIDGARAFQQEVNEILAPHTMAEETLAAVQEQPEPERPLLIGLGGKLASGKDTFADFLTAEYGFQKLGMSDPLATALYTLNPWIGERYDEEGHYVEQIRYREVIDDIGYTGAKRIPEVRRLLQALGTEVGRDQLGPDTWTNAARGRIEKIRAAGVPVVLTGIRYPNELELISSLGGTLVWVERPEPNLLAFGSPEGAQPAENIGQAVIHAIDNALDPDLVQFHSSEVTLTKSDFHITVTNDGTIEQLRQRAVSLIESLGGIEAEQAMDPEYEAQFPPMDGSAPSDEFDG